MSSVSWEFLNYKIFCNADILAHIEDDRSKIPQPSWLKLAGEDRST
ncbi:hypothetical protein [Chamaesiphon sp. OTE_20_metabat_361]|nr:hypothetical protein [Chamaesiphon sp. OTE_20_metabat_361]